jgi:hypothetical protein
MKLKIWIGIILSFLFKFGLPLGVAYWKFGIAQEGVGGSFFYFITTIIFIAFYVKLRRIIHKQKPTRTKIVFKFVLNIITAIFLYGVTTYIGTNFAELVYVILSWILGYTLGSIAEWVVVPLDKDYMEEIGVI